ncbi:carboxypeptidase-like regulatory domain-containing protein [Patiriisocius marinus]|uniref:carboxypeptidase-like regulatory domain-containing protein n=1 Tax=Patiriisocius marinus TaxID=1397112 RepID=UPI00232BE9E0|nr:carboxypeptidase-like regulatory domain-containing protein [Patiriisocius marinus]
MKTTHLLLFFLFISLSSFAQEISRIPIDGSITAPVGEPVEGIHIYNISAQKGTITDENGFFKMEMAVNDRLEVTALQFVSFKVVIDEGVIKNKQVKIYMNPAVNELAEVIIRPYDLTGNIKVDVSKIKTFDVAKNLDLSYEEITFAYDFAPDAQTSIKGNYAEEVFYNGQSQNGGNVLGLVALLADAIFRSSVKTKSPEQLEAENQKLLHSFKARFTDEIMVSRFHIPEDKAAQFRYYLEDQNIPQNLMKLENELLLFEYIKMQSSLFLKEFKE